jgi:hypothetical protein
MFQSTKDHTLQTTIRYNQILAVPSLFALYLTVNDQVNVIKPMPYSLNTDSIIN